MFDTKNVGGAGTAAASAAELIDLIRDLEDQKAACAAQQAQAATELLARRVAERAQRGVPAARRERGVATEIALARRESPARGDTHLGFAKAMIEMPHTFHLLYTGVLSEWRATLLVRETACLTRDDRQIVDSQMCSDASIVEGLGTGQLVAAARERAAHLDAEAMTRRAAKAAADRRVSSRPAPDTMAYLSALLPVRDAVAVEATLRRDAAGICATGDQRTPSQVMADLLVERVTGIDTTVGPPIVVNLVLSDQALLNGGSDPAHVNGHGPIPAGMARAWVKQGADTDAELALRRVYSAPATGALTAMESTARCFPKALATLIDTRDRTCRTPWCDAPIRHHDHITDYANDGPTTADNAAGLCQACNHAKQAPGWTAAADPPKHVERHSYTFTTPTGHTYRSTAPPLPTPVTIPAA